MNKTLHASPSRRDTGRQDGTRPRPAALVVHAETLVVADDRPRRAGRPDRASDRESCAPLGRPRGHGEPVVDAHDLRALHQRSAAGAARRHQRFLEQIVARDGEWMHNDPQHSDCDRMNADAHLRAMLLGHSLTLQISGGELVLGTVAARARRGDRRPARPQRSASRSWECVTVRSSASRRLRPRRHRRRSSTPASGCRSRTACACSSAPTCSRSAGWRTASARSGTARAPTTTSTSGSKRPTSASRAACSARSRG